MLAGTPDLINKKLFLFALFICAFIIYGFSLPFSLNIPHFSPGNDFSNHAHYMYRFAESFKHGQIIPRTIIGPSIFSDATVATYDIPTFQYYGSFEGIVGLPFHLLGFSDTNAAVLSSILIRFIGLWIVFETGLLLGASSLTAFLASISLLLSPYTLTVFYGRGALAETFAQSLLTLIPYAYALAWRGRINAAIVTVAMACCLLTLCHNIFLLYGLLLIAVLGIFSFQIRILSTMGIGSVIGILLSAWQWLPAQKTLSDIVIFSSMNSLKLGAPGVELHAASLSGALGFPHPFMPAGVGHALPIYFTLGWWTLPFILLTFKVLFQKNKRSLALPFLISSILFIVLTFWPFNLIYNTLVPQLLGIVQDTSRLLGFISLLGAICLLIVVPKIKIRVFIVLMTLMIISQTPLFLCYVKLVTQKSWTNDEIRSAPINYYYSNPKQSDAMVLLKQSTGSLYSENKFYISEKKYKHFSVHLAGLAPSDKTFQVSIAALRKNSASGLFEIDQLSKPQSIQSDFSIHIEMPTISPSGWYKIILSDDKNAASVAFYQIDITPGDIRNYIFPDNLDLPKKLFGYSRQYAVKKNEISQFNPDSEGFYTLQLPQAYSRLFSVKQNNSLLLSTPDYNHRMLVRTKDLYTPIHVSYRFDFNAIMLTMMGMLGLFVSLRFKGKKTNEK